MKTDWELRQMILEALKKTTPAEFVLMACIAGNELSEFILPAMAKKEDWEQKKVGFGKFARQRIIGTVDKLLNKSVSDSTTDQSKEVSLQTWHTVGKN